MAMKKKLHEMAVFIEFLVGSGLAIFFHAVLKYEEAAYTIFALGILLSLATYLVREEIERAKVALLEQYRLDHEIPGALAAITDPECQNQAQEFIAATLKSLGLLQQGYIQLDEMAFYLEGAKLADQAVRQINCVDPLNAGWLTRATLVNYYQSNLRAKERGVHVTRVFVTSREELADPELHKVLVAQHKDGVDVRLALRDELPKALDISGRDTSSSLDFAIYDNAVVTEVFAQPGKFYGRKTCQSAEVAKYQNLYNQIEHGAHVVDVKDGVVVLSSTVVPLIPTLQPGSAADADRLPR